MMNYKSSLTKQPTSNFRSLSLVLLTVLFLSVGCNKTDEYFKTPEGALLKFYPTESSSQSIDQLEIGRQPFATTSKNSFYLRNEGQLDARVYHLFVDKDEDMYSFKHNCPAFLPSRASCKVDVIHTPMALGRIKNSLKVNYSNGRSNSQSLLDISSEANNLSALSFEQSSVSVPSATVGYTLSTLIKVIYNGSLIPKHSDIQILPASGVIISNPTLSVFRIDRTSGSTTCGEVIKENCYIKIDYTPVQNTTSKAQFTMNYFNGSEVNRIEAKVLGTPQTAAVLASLSTPSTVNANDIIVGGGAGEVIVPVNFSGSVSATEVEIASDNSHFKISSDQNLTTCTELITGNCQYHLTYTPTHYGQISTNFIIRYKSNGTQRPDSNFQTIGNGVRPGLINPNIASHNLGSIPVYKQVDNTIVLTNSGESVVTGISWTTSGSSHFSLPNEASCSTLAPGASCNLTLRFLANMVGNDQKTLTATYFDGLIQKNFTVTASAESIPNLTFIPDITSIDFGNVMIGAPSLPSPINVNLGIFGTEKLTTLSNFVVSDVASPFATTLLSTSQCTPPFNPNMPAGRSCQFDVSVTNNSGTPDQVINKNFSIQYTGDNLTSGTMNFQTKMTLRSPPVLIYKNILEFAKVSVNDQLTKSIVLKNSSPYFPVTLKTIYFKGAHAHAFSVQSKTCGGTLAPNAECTVVVAFKPESAGIFLGNMNYTYSDGIMDQTASSEIVNAIGSDLIKLSASTATVNFGTVYTDQIPSPITIDIDYKGNIAYVMSSNANSPISVDTSSCGPKSNCQIQFSLNPVASQNVDSQISIFYTNALNAPGVLQIRVLANISVKSSNIALVSNNFGKKPVGVTQPSLSLVIKNTGNGSGTISELPQLNGTVFKYSTGGAPGNAGRCAVGQLLTAGESCDLMLDITAIKIRENSIPFVIKYLDGLQTKTEQTDLLVTGTQQVQVFAGANQTCIIDEIAHLRCFGRNSYGQLGLGHNNPVNGSVQSQSPIFFASATIVKKVALGDSHTCAIVNQNETQDRVVCWGSNENGKLGRGISTSLLPSPVSGGANQYVELGQSGGIPHSVTDISAGFEHSCAVLDNGAVKCWGGNSGHQLGLGHAKNIGSLSTDMGDSLPEINLQSSPAQSVSAGPAHTCINLASGDVKCFGDNFYGQLGLGTQKQKVGDTLVEMQNLEIINLGKSIKEVSAAPGAFTCALASTGEVKCFGKATFDENTSSPSNFLLGQCWARQNFNYSIVPCEEHANYSPALSVGYLPSDLPNLEWMKPSNVKIASLATGLQSTCLLGEDGLIRCFGANHSGQQGAGDRIHRDITNHSLIGFGSANAVQIASGYDHMCAALSNNQVKCWGSSVDNANGLHSHGFSNGDAGVESDSLPSLLPSVYNGN